MPTIRELRQQQTPQQNQRSGLLATALIGVAAFVIGALAIMGWKYLPSPKLPMATAESEQPAPKFGDMRIGRSGTAPLLRICIKGDAFDVMSHADPEAILAILNAASTTARLASLFGAAAGDQLLLTEFWREIADCVFRQNSWHLCDVDNRALAVESASAFIRHATRLAADPPKSRDAQMVLRGIENTRERVLDALRERLRNGQLIAADFGVLPPAEIKRLFANTKPVANACNQ